MSLTLSSHLSLGTKYGIFLSCFQAIIFNYIVTDPIKRDVSVTEDVPKKFAKLEVLCYIS